MAEVPVLQEQQTGRPPWMAEVPVLQEQQTGRLLFSDSLLGRLVKLNFCRFRISLCGELLMQLIELGFCRGQNIHALTR